MSVLQIAAVHGAESLEQLFFVRLLADPMSSAMEANRANLDLYVGIGLDVVPPSRVAILATIGCDDNIVILVGDVEEGRAPPPHRSAAGGRENEDVPPDDATLEQPVERSVHGESERR
jgi:hypothetical protein